MATENGYNAKDVLKDYLLPIVLIAVGGLAVWALKLDDRTYRLAGSTATRGDVVEVRQEIKQDITNFRREMKVDLTRIERKLDSYNERRTGSLYAE